jgi:DNA-binding transcriptional LysR family regulator
VLGDLRELRAEMAEHAGAARGRLRIGAWYTVDPWLPEMVAPFHAAHPSVDVTVREVNSDRMLDLLRAGDLDVALPVLRPGLDLDEIELLPYIEEPFVLAAPAGSTLAAMRSVTLADVAGEPLITFNPGSSLRRLVEQAFAASGLEPRVALETIETSAARAMVSSGLGVAILPASVAQRPGPPVAVVPLDAAPVRRSAFAWRRGPGSPARDAFLVTASRWRDGRGEPSRPGRGGGGSREGGAQADARRPMGEALRARDAAEAAHAKSEGAAQKAEQDAIARASSPGSSPLRQTARHGPDLGGGEASFA